MFLDLGLDNIFEAHFFIDDRVYFIRSCEWIASKAFQRALWFSSDTCWVTSLHVVSDGLHKTQRQSGNDLSVLNKTNQRLVEGMECIITEFGPPLTIILATFSALVIDKNYSGNTSICPFHSNRSRSFGKHSEKSLIEKAQALSSESP